MRYVVTGDGMLIAGSEAGMVPIDETTVREKGALGPGQMIAVDMAEGKLYHDAALKDKLAAAQPFGDWIEKVIDLNALLRDVPEAPLFDGSDLRKRQIAAGYTVEELEQVLAPMAEDGKEMIASMGDDTPRGGAVEHLPPAVAFLPPELQPGHEPAHRQPARRPGDEPEDAFRQPQERAG
jgi:glutamate synthase (NADPH/NADH) large chain